MFADFYIQTEFEAAPRLVVAAGEDIILPEQSSETAYILESGEAKCRTTGHLFEPGTVVSLIEFLAYEHYVSPVRAKTDCRLITCQRDDLKNLVSSENSLTWPLSCQLAADVANRREQRA